MSSFPALCHLGLKCSEWNESVPCPRQTPLPELGPRHQAEQTCHTQRSVTLNMGRPPEHRSRTDLGPMNRSPHVPNPYPDPEGKGSPAKKGCQPDEGQGKEEGCQPELPPACAPCPSSYSGLEKVGMVGHPSPMERPDRDLSHHGPKTHGVFSSFSSSSSLLLHQGPSPGELEEVEATEEHFGLSAQPPSVLPP